MLAVGFLVLEDEFIRLGIRLDPQLSDRDHFGIVLSAFCTLERGIWKFIRCAAKTSPVDMFRSFAAPFLAFDLARRTPPICNPAPRPALPTVATTILSAVMSRVQYLRFQVTPSTYPRTPLLMGSTANWETRQAHAFLLPCEFPTPVPLGLSLPAACEPSPQVQ